MAASTHESFQLGDEDMGESQSAPRKRKVSEVWNHFSVVKGDDGKSTAKCNYCNKSYTYAGSKYGTSTFSRHLEKCKNKLKLDDEAVVFIDHEEEGMVTGEIIDEKTYRDWVAKATIAHDLPFEWVEYEEMWKLLKFLNEDVPFVSGETVSLDVYKMYVSEKKKLKSTLKNIPGMVCLTSNIWTVCDIVGYICVSAHYVDEKWKLNSKLLSFCVKSPPHSGLELAQEIYDCLANWEIDKKVFSLTLDDASVDISTVEMLKTRLLLQKSLMCNGEYFHVRCSANVLNLIVQEGLKVANRALDKIRASLKYLRETAGRWIKFREYGKKVGIEITPSFSLDVPTRWNSTYFMLARAIKYRRVFGMMAFDDLSFKSWPTDDDWERGEWMIDFLRPFYRITNWISSSSYPMSNLCFIEVWKIKLLLEKYSLSNDEVVREMSLNMKEKFAEYWETYSETLAMGAIFDPRIKLTMLGYCYSKLDAASSQEKVKNLKTKLHLLYDEYKKRVVASPSRVERREEEGLDFSPFDFSDYENFKKTSASDPKSPLDKYLDEDQYDETKEIDVLEFWKDKESIFGLELARMACNLLSIPITTALSESSFSIGAHIFNKYRSKLIPKRVQARLCIRNWLHGYPNDDDDGEAEIEEASNDV